MGYAIPINVAKEVIETMSKRKDRESIPEEEQGQLGITARNIDSQTAESLGMPEGIYVFKINDDAPAKNSELKEKDIIISFDDQPVKTVSELQELLRYTRAGQEVPIKVKRLSGSGEDVQYVEKEFKVKLAKKSINAKQQQNSQQQQNNQQPNSQQGNEQQPSEGYYYDPFNFNDMDELFRNFGKWGW